MEVGFTLKGSKAFKILRLEMCHITQVSLAVLVAFAVYVLCKYLGI